MTENFSMWRPRSAGLRLRPDRIIISEVGDGSVPDLLKAWNTGHPGGLAMRVKRTMADAST